MKRRCTSTISSSSSNISTTSVSLPVLSSNQPVSPKSKQQQVTMKQKQQQQQQQAIADSVGTPTAVQTQHQQQHLLSQQSDSYIENRMNINIQRQRQPQPQRQQPRNRWSSFVTYLTGDFLGGGDGSRQRRPRLQQQRQQQLPQPEGGIQDNVEEMNDRWNYMLLIALYTLQGIPMGLSASIPFLIQQKIQHMSSHPIPAALHHKLTETLQDQQLHTIAPIATAAAATAATAIKTSTATAIAHSAQRDSYNANAIFALCTWPFSLKLLWAPIVDACFFQYNTNHRFLHFGRRKSWIVPVQSLAGILMIYGSNFVEQQLGFTISSSSATPSFSSTINVKGITIYFFLLYFLMATQDIAVDGWALTMLSKQHRGYGPICNSIGQNIGYFISFVGFLALNDIESCEVLWRPLLHLPSNPNSGLLSLGSFIRYMGYFMLIVTSFVAFFKTESTSSSSSPTYDSKNDSYHGKVIMNKKVDNNSIDNDTDMEDTELDASVIGLRETYHRLYSVCTLPAVQWLFLILLTYRLPTSLSDNVKFLKAVEYGLSKSTTALLSPTVILPLGIIVPIIATRIWHNSPLQQFMSAYQLRVTLVPILDILMLLAVRNGTPNGLSSYSGLFSYWFFIISSTALQAITSSMQFNAQMTFFAKRVDPAIGGSYMTLLNTAANLGGTWPASFVMWIMSIVSKDPICTTDITTGIETCTTDGTGFDPYFQIQILFSLLGILWIVLFSKLVKRIEHLPDDAWRTHAVSVQEQHKNSNPTRLQRRQQHQSSKLRPGGCIGDDDEESLLLLSSVDVELVPSKGK